MKKIVLLLSILLLFFSCSDNPDNEDLSESPIVELEVSPSGDAITSRRVQGKISTIGEVDRYHLNINETGRILQIKCTSDTIRPDVDLLVHVFEQDANGNLKMIKGIHAPEDAIQAADLKINIYIDHPKNLYIHVRDLKDDDASDNPYYLTAHYEAAPDGNGTFETAVPLVPGSAVEEDTIGTIGDVDCFSFSVAETGVYDVFVDFLPVSGTDVRLSMELYGPDGILIEGRVQGGNNQTHMVHYLSATISGETYKLVVRDDGQNDFDSMSRYTVNVSQNTPVEIKTNDTPGNAGSDMSGTLSIDYFEDIDWYIFSVEPSSDIDIMDLTFDSDTTMTYRVSMYIIDVDDVNTFDTTAETPVFAHDFRSAKDPEYHAVLKLDKLETGQNYYLAVQPRNGAEVTGNSPYILSADITSINDPDENDPGNNTDATAIDLSSTPTHDGKIAYRGDLDWFEITIPVSTTDRVLSINFDVPDNTNVEYALDIVRRTRLGEDEAYGLSKQIRHTSSEYRNVDLKTAFIVPDQSDGNTDATYYVKVYDFQNDDGEDATYTLNWSISDIPNALASPPPNTGVTSPIYNDEKAEQSSTSIVDADYDTIVTINYSHTAATFEYSTGTTQQYRVKNTMKALSTGTATDNGDGTTTITMPWIGGYVDYQGDEDWYSLDLSTPYASGDMEWYYEIQIQLVAGSSPVEYVWDYFPDTDNDNIVTGGACHTNAASCEGGVAANGGDVDIAQNLVNSLFPADDPRNDPSPATPWIGSMDTPNPWKGVVFFRVSDFNFIRLSDTEINPDADDDWGGYDAPYFFRVILTYHSYASRPPEAE